VLETRCREFGLKPEDIWWYADLRRCVVNIGSPISLTVADCGVDNLLKMQIRHGPSRRLRSGLRASHHVRNGP
jgi:hypothetical protein